MSKIIALVETESVADVIQHCGHAELKQVCLENFPQCKLPAIAVKYIKRQIKEGVKFVLIPPDAALLTALEEEGIDVEKTSKESPLVKFTHPDLFTVVKAIERSASLTIETELTGGMVVYVDDIRDPRRFLKPEQCKDVWWVKHWFAAKNFLFKHEAEIEVLHLDHYLGNEEGLLVEHIVEGELVDTSAHIENTRGHTRDHSHTGADLFHMVVSYRRRGRMFANLKRIYLHSNAREITVKLMREHHDELGQMGIALIHNPQEW